MSSADDTRRLLGAFVDELARCGMTDACTSPGSRCAPLVLALAGEQRLRCHSHIDERCAGFFALGLAKAARLPVAVTCTSGTAVAELLPAVVEAHEARVPLIVLSADRPPELRDVGAGQTIDQLGIFGRFAKWFFEVGTHECSDERVRWMRMLACRAYWTALDGQPGVVHLNFALREPLVSEQPPGPAAGGGRPDGRPLLSRFPSRHLRPEDEDSLAQALQGRRRGVVVAGRHERDTPLGDAAARFCASAGWPLLADPMSGARRGAATVAHYDALLRSGAFAERMRPDIVLRVGDLPVSKPLRSWLAAMPDVPQAAIDAEGVWHDPDATLCRTFALEPAAALSAVSAPPADPDWLAAWRSADERAAEAIREVVAGAGTSRAGLTASSGAGGATALSEPLVAAELGILLPEQATLFVASSMPVRDIETFWPARPDPPRVLCNRGANGIDGTVSSAFGAVAAGQGPVVLLIGDVALAHDLGGLLASERLGLKLTIVLLNNGGGGIFDFLPVAHAPAARARPGGDKAGDLGGEPGDEPGEVGGATVDEDARAMGDDVYTRHIATPTGLDFFKAAALYGLDHVPVADVEAFRAALEQAIAAPRSTLIEVAGERTVNVDLHRQLWDAVGAAMTDV